MAYKHVTKRDAVLQAMQEFDRMGRDAFLSKYGYWKAKRYYLVHHGARYDSKALYGVSFGYEHPENGPLRSNDFSGGEAQVARRLVKLGFEVEKATAEPSGPPHLRRTWLLTSIGADERLYQGHGGYDDDLRVVYRYDSFVPNHLALCAGDAVVLRDKSQVLGCAVIERIDQTPGSKRRNHCPTCGATALKERHRATPRYRCECGATFDVPDVIPDECVIYAAYFGSSFQSLAGTVAIRDLWALAPRLNKQLAMLELNDDRAASLLGGIAEAVGLGDEPPVAARSLFREGERTAVLVNRYERDPRARKACVEHYGPKCSVCGFSFAEQYGDIGRGVVEVHHLEPLGARRVHHGVDAVRDMRPLCANCHTIVHRRTPPFSLEEVRRFLDT